MSILFKKSLLFIFLTSVVSISNSYALHNSYAFNNDTIFDSRVPNPPEWVYEYSGTDEIQNGTTRHSYRDILKDHYSGTTHDYCFPEVQVSESGLATDDLFDGVNQWQIDRYQILKRIQNQQNIVKDVIASNQPMNYYLSLLRILINSACQLKDDIKNGLYINDLDPNLNERGLISYKGAVYKLKDICSFIIDKMIELVTLEQSRHLVDFESDFGVFYKEHVTNEQLEHMYRKLRHAIKQNNK